MMLCCNMLDGSTHVVVASWPVTAGQAPGHLLPKVKPRG
jgi:hypothetical protein